ncbi:uncharacterized protein [Coffea arabica]|uniref:Integrase catalytic domain-containing protein n=1 Tax=Coffea arabica TaxID=13443 RepID=A0ABM4WMI5_COFAR
MGESSSSSPEKGGSNSRREPGRVLPNRDNTGRPGEKYIHLPIWHVCLPENAFWPMQYSNNFSKVYVDYVSKWVEAKATRTNNSKVVTEFLRSNIFVRFGMPRAVVSDRGTHFCNKTVAALFRKYDVLHKVAAPHHLQTNDQAEVSNREIKSILEKMVRPDGKDWNLKLEDAL